MMRFLLFFITYFSITLSVHAGCLKIPSKDFSSDEKREISSKNYIYLGTLKNQCLYFRDVVFNNGHGQQTIVVADRSGICLGSFRTSLADSAELDGTKLFIKAASGEVFKVELSNGIPKSLFFDGDESIFERCIN